MPDAIVDSARFAFDWRKTGFARYYAYLALLGLAWFFSEDFLKTKLDWMALLEPAIPGASYAFLLALALTLLFSFFSAVVELLVLGMALKARRQKTRKFDSLDFLTYFLIDFVVFIAAVMSAFNPRGLILLVALVLAFAVAFATNSTTLWMIAVILFSVYAFVFLYNILRLSQTQFFFASQNRDLLSAVRNSLDATLGNVLWLVGVSIGVFVLVGLVSLVIVGAPTIVGGFSYGFSSMAVRITTALLTPVMVFSFLFAGTSIYSFLLNKKKKKAEWKF